MACVLGTAGERIYQCRACDQPFVVEQPTAARGRAREWPQATCPLCGAADQNQAEGTGRLEREV
jgi:hypothetical protein